MDLNENLLNTFIETCGKLHFPIQGINIQELLHRISAGENFVYFASDEQKLKIMERLASYRWVHFGNQPRIYCIENCFDEDLGRHEFSEHWMPASLNEEVEDSVAYYATCDHADHGYYIVDFYYNPVDITELI